MHIYLKKDLKRWTCLLLICALLPSCYFYNSTKGRIKIRQHLKKEIKKHYNDSFNINNIWVFDDWGRIEGYSAIIEYKADDNIQFQYFIPNVHSLNFDSSAFNQAYRTSKAYINESYELKDLTLDFFKDAVVSTEVITTNYDELRRISKIYTNQTLQNKEEMLTQIDSLTKVVSTNYNEPLIIFNIYFASEDQEPIIPIGKRGILKHEVYHDLYLYHYRVDFKRVDSIYTKSNQSLTLNLSGPNAVVMQKSIKYWLGEDVNPETERDKSYLLVEKNPDRNILWAKFMYLDTLKQKNFAYINVYTKEIKTETPN